MGEQVSYRPFELQLNPNSALGENRTKPSSGGVMKIVPWLAVMLRKAGLPSDPVSSPTRRPALVQASDTADFKTLSSAPTSSTTASSTSGRIAARSHLAGSRRQ